MNLTSRSPVAKSGAEARHLIRQFNRRLPRRMPRYRYPRGQELEYERALLAEFRRMLERITSVYIPAVFHDADAPPIGYQIALARRAAENARHVAMGIGTVHAAAIATAVKLDKANREQVIGGLERITGVRMQLPEAWKPKLLRGWAQENAQLVSKVSHRFRAKLSNAVTQGILGGKTDDQILAMIQAQYVNGAEAIATEKRLRNIVRDQTAKLQGSLTRERYQEVGINRYLWRTEQDERVRHTHHEREGFEFTFGREVQPQLRAYKLDVDQIDGHPSVPPNCRCHAEPVLADLLTVNS